MPRRRATAETPPTALITGASSGIGAALARCFARGGHRLVLVARHEERLQAVADTLRAEHHGAVEVVCSDLTRPGAVPALAAGLSHRRRRIDVLVNNAGVVEQGAFTAIAAARHQQLIALNVAVLTEMLSTFVPPMVARGHGRVLNLASIAAFHPVPGLATYAASKSFVLSLTESLAEELKDSGVTVGALCPGITDTPMLARARAQNPRLAQLPEALVGDVDEVAEAGYQACMAGDAVTVPGAINQGTAWVAQVMPKWLLRRIAGRLGRPLM
jgi:short-subunit dehydrogenase